MRNTCGYGACVMIFTQMRFVWRLADGAAGFLKVPKPVHELGGSGTGQALRCLFFRLRPQTLGKLDPRRGHLQQHRFALNVRDYA